MTPERFGQITRICRAALEIKPDGIRAAPRFRDLLRRLGFD